MFMCMESVYVVGGCKLLAKGCSCMVGCCSWLRSIRYSNRLLLLEKSFCFDCYYAVFIRAYTACTNDCCVCSGGDCRIAVETSVFF